MDIEGVRFHVRDAYAAGNKIIIVTEVSYLDNDMHSSKLTNAC